MSLPTIPIAVNSDIIPPVYRSKSQFFRALNEYQSSLTEIESPFDLESLKLTTVSIDQLTYHQFLTAYYVDQFFQHEERLAQLQILITQYWSNGYYDDHKDYEAIYQVVNNLVFSNQTCATMIYLRQLHRQFRRVNHPSKFSNNQWTTLHSRQYWNKIRREALEYVQFDDVTFLNNEREYTFDKSLSMVSRLNGTPILFDNQGILGDAAVYYAVLNEQPVKSVNNNVRFNRSLFQYLRFEDLNNPVWNRLYPDHRHEYTYQQALQRLRELINQFNDDDDRFSLVYDVKKNSNSNTEYPREIFYNNDERVIRELITIFANRGYLPAEDNDNLIPAILSYGSPAAIKLLGLDSKIVAKATRRVDVITSLTNPELRDTWRYQSEVGWHCVLNGIKCDLEWFIDHVIINHTQWIEDVLDKTEIVKRINCVLLYQYDRQLAHLIAKMGGRIRLCDLDVMEGEQYAAENIYDTARPLTMETLEFMLEHDYQLTEQDRNSEYFEALPKIAHQDGRVLERLSAVCGVEVKVDIPHYHMILRPHQELPQQSIIGAGLNIITVEMLDTMMGRTMW